MQANRRDTPHRRLLWEYALFLPTYLCIALLTSR
jgi:hypothetical protein